MTEDHDKDTRKGFWKLWGEITSTPKEDPKHKAKQPPKHRKEDKK